MIYVGFNPLTTNKLSNKIFIVRILLSSICLETGTDIQLALYYLKSYILNRKSTFKGNLKVKIEVYNEDQSLSVIVKNILSSNPDLIGFSCYVWNIDKTIKICRRLKKINPKLKIILAGPEATPLAGYILAREKSVDAIVRGEGEASFAQLVEVLTNKNSDLSCVKGVSFRLGKTIINNPDRLQLRNINKIPSPYLTGLINLKDKDIIDIPLETTRGCFFCCHYCYYHKNLEKVRYFSLLRVEKELKLILRHKPHELYLMDATFNSNPARAKRILRMLIKYNKGSNLHVELKAELIDKEMALLLYRANAYNIEIGIQSINSKTLNAVNRHFNKEKFKNGISFLNNYGLYYEIQLIDALPFQSYGILKKSLDWLYKLHPAKVEIFKLSIIPGTTLNENAAKFGIIYDPRAPYYVYKSNAISRKDLVKVDKLRFAMERLYDSQVFQMTMYQLKERAGIKISDIMEDWIIWKSRLRSSFAVNPDRLNRKLPEFLEYICRKHGKILLYKKLLPGLLTSLPE